MGKNIVKVTADFDYSKVGRFKTGKLEGLVSSKKNGLPLVDTYFINPAVYRYFKRKARFSSGFRGELKKAVSQLLVKYGQITLRTCFKFKGLENPRGLLSWRNLQSYRNILKSVRAAFEHGEEVAQKNNVSQFELGLILMGRIDAEKGGIIVVDIEKERLLSLDACLGDAKLIAMGEGRWDTFWVNEALEIVGKKIREKPIGYFFRGNERKTITIPKQKRKLPALSEEEIVSLARHAFRAARFHRKNLEIEFMINKVGLIDMYELQVKPGIEVSPRVIKKKKKGVLVRGLSACPGRVEGRVRVIAAEADLAKILPGEIVAIHLPKTDVCLPIFSKAAAIVADCGGTTSHFATVARDFNIPCIVGTERGTEVLKDGMEVIVDAERGEVWAR